jgi:hypothetical protein
MSAVVLVEYVSRLDPVSGHDDGIFHAQEVFGVLSFRDKTR